MVGLVRHRRTKGPATDRPYLNHRATPRLHVIVDLKSVAKLARLLCGLPYQFASAMALNALFAIRE